MAPIFRFLALLRALWSSTPFLQCTFSIPINPRSYIQILTFRWIIVFEIIHWIQNFETGQVYEVLYKDQLGNFQPFVRTNQIQAAIKKDDDNEFDNMDFDQDKNEESGNESAQQTKFLIYIVNQPLNFNEEAVTITFFKDITFGVLYE